MWVENWPVEFRVLGPLEVADEGRALPLGGRKQKAVLLLLLLARGEVVSRARLIEELWAGDAPPGAEITLRSYVSRLRTVVGPARLVRRAPGYLITVTADELDAARFERLAAEGRAELTAGRTARAGELLGEALELWRGPAAADVVDALPPQGELGRLEELRMLALEGWIEAELQAGRTDELVGELRSLVARHRTREQLWAQLMIALYRSGRQSDALAAYTEARALLIEELGLEPGEGLQELQRAILRHELPARAGQAAGARDARAIGSGDLRPVPVALTSFVGRSSDRRDAATALGEHRLVTLTGIGGVGKTRLAQAVAGAWPGAAAWVDLASVADERLVGATVARAIGLTETRPRDAPNMVAEALGDGELLLVLDNCEHLIDEVARLLELWLGPCGSLRVLATSREPLRVPGERVLTVAPLPVQAAGHSVPDAARLFFERARLAGAAVDDAPETLASAVAICRYLDGVPLAIELAAARVASLGTRGIRDSLDQALSILTGGARTSPARHRTLEQSIGWSYELLDAREQALLLRLSVFAGEFSLAAATAVCSRAPVEADDMPGLLAALVDKSLLQPSFRAANARYRLLEVVRQFARQRLERPGERKRLQARHAEWIVQELERLAPELLGERGIELLDELEAQLDDIRAAAVMATEAGDSGLALRLLSAPWLLWICRHPAEGRERLEQALAADPDADPEVVARARVAASWLAIYVFDNHASRAHAEAAFELGAHLDEATVQAQARTLLGWNALFLDPGAAKPILVAAVAESEAAGDRHHLAHALSGLGVLSAHYGRPADAIVLLERALQTARRGADLVGIRRALAFSGVVLAVRGDFSQAEAQFTECERITRALGDRYFLSQALDYLALIALHRGDFDLARDRVDESLTVARRSSHIALCRSHTMTALLCLALGEFDAATFHAGHAVAVVRERGLNWHFATTFGVAAEAYRRAGRGEVSQRLRAEGVAMADAVLLVWARASAQAAGDRADDLIPAVGQLAQLGHVPELVRAVEALAFALEPDGGDEPGWLIEAAASIRRQHGLVPFPVDRARIERAPARLSGDRRDSHGAVSLDEIVRRIGLRAIPEVR